VGKPRASSRCAPKSSSGAARKYAILEKLTVLSRNYCHLCDDLIAVLRSYLDEAGGDVAVLDVIDIDAYPALEAVWGDKVPVLLAGEAPQQEICHYFFDRARLEAYFAQVRNRVTAA
jgi:Glutaredoxin-like domain (DUF836)